MEILKYFIVQDNANNILFIGKKEYLPQYNAGTLKC